MKIAIVNLKKKSSQVDLLNIIKYIVKANFETVVFTGYERSMQESLLHPLQKHFGNSSSEIIEGMLIVSRVPLDSFNLEILKDTSNYSISKIEV